MKLKTKTEYYNINKIWIEELSIFKRIVYILARDIVFNRDKTNNLKGIMVSFVELFGTRNSQVGLRYRIVRVVCECDD